MITIELFKNTSGFGKIYTPAPAPQPPWYRDVPEELRFFTQSDLDKYLETAPVVGSCLKYKINQSNFDLYCFFLVVKIENNLNSLIKNTRNFPCTHYIMSLSQTGKVFPRWDCVHDMEVVPQYLYDQHLKQHHDHIQACLKAHTS